MINFIKGLFSVLLIIAVIVVVARVFLVVPARTNSYSMIPNLVPGDLFLVYSRAKLGPGDVAVCKNPEDPSSMVVLRIMGVPGSTFEMRDNRMILQGKQMDHLDPSGPTPITYVDNTSGERLEYIVSIAGEAVGGNIYDVAMMERAGSKEYGLHEVQGGFFLIGDNRNRAHDSREFGEIPISDCIGRAFILIWPGEDSGDLKLKNRILNWIH